MKKITFWFLLFLAVCPLAFAGKFTIPVIPDSQHEVNFNVAQYTSQMDWIVSHKTTLHIPIVLHVGDVIDADTPDHRMWKTASEGFSKLDKDGIAYAIAVGNHDTGGLPGGKTGSGDKHANLRTTEQFNSFFPVDRFVAQQGRYEKGKSDNAWYTFKAEGLDWLVLTLEFCARQEAVDWAKTVVASHPAHNVIVLTHAYMMPDGTIMQNNNGYGDLSPQAIYTELISRYPNILMVFSGHIDSSARKEDIGQNGNRIFEILQDYQNEDNGGGYIRLLEIDTTAGTLSARMYSPYYDLTKNDSSQFSFSGVKFIHPGK